MFPLPKTSKTLSLVVVSCLFAAACGGGAPPKRPPPTVGVVIITTGPVQLTANLPGRTDSYEVSDVRPQVGGILLKRLFVEGSNVRAGQPLYQIDPAPFRAAYDNAAAALPAAKAMAERFGALMKSNAVAQQDYDNAVAAYKQAVANVKTAAINLDYTTVRAPIGGRIGRSAVTEGALVTIGQTTALATIQTLDPIYVDITQSNVELLNLKQAMQGGRLTNNGPSSARAMLTLDNGSPYPLAGTLQFSEVTVDETTGSVTLRAIFPQSRRPASSRHLRARHDHRGRRAQRDPGAAAGHQPQREGRSDRAGGRCERHRAAAPAEGIARHRRQMARHQRAQTG